MRREELEPRERVAKGLVQRDRIVHCEVPERSPYPSERVGALGLTVRPCETEVGLVATAKQNVAVLDVVGDVLRLAEEVRERPLDQSHAGSISELLQIYERRCTPHVRARRPWGFSSVAEGRWHR